MIVNRNLWQKLEHRIGYNSSKYTKIKLKIVEVLSDSTVYRLPKDGEYPDYIYKVRKDDDGNLYFNYFHKQSIKKDMVFPDLDYYTATIIDKQTPDPIRGAVVLLPPIKNKKQGCWAEDYHN
tara:strand:+ start:1630 stop:1995 length:366 start_codon:yes stop_codon:yes gene_type:complete